LALSPFSSNPLIDESVRETGDHPVNCIGKLVMYLMRGEEVLTLQKP
jgi:hypothetical protein